MFPWLFFFVLIIGMIALDLGIVNRNRQPLTLTKSMVWSCVWISLALAFCGYIYWSQGSSQAIDFITGYMIEKVLSFDNLLVFVVIFNTFQLTAKDQHRILLWGVLGAIVLRGLFIALGSALMSRLHWMLYFFGLFLLFTAIKMAVQKKQPLDFTQTRFYQICQNILPIAHDTHSHRFFVIKDGSYAVTPLFLALLSIEILDLIFAIDSIPAIFAITLDPFIVYTSNIFAILGLRAHYFLLRETIKRYEYLTKGLAYILGFAGIKMLIQDFIEISNFLSFVIILGIIIISLLISRHKLTVFDNKKQSHDRHKNEDGN